MLLHAALLRLLWVALLIVLSSGLVLRETGGGVRDQVYHLHIPKTAGLSFMADELDILKKHGLTQISQEGCFSFQDRNPKVFGTSVMLRNPRKHIVSMYHFGNAYAVFERYRDLVRPPKSLPFPSTFEAWVKEWRRLQDDGWHGDFTPNTWAVTGKFALNAETWCRKVRIAAWSNPPWMPRYTPLKEEDWTVLDGGGTLWHHTKVPFQSYVPVNFQTQRLSCQKAMEWPDVPQIATARKNMESAWFVGLVEHYQASICLLRLQLGEAPPPYCDCSKPALWATYKGQKVNQVNHPKETSYSEDIRREMDKLVESDLELYRAGQERFMREARKMEEKHHIKLLCNFSLLV